MYVNAPGGTLSFNTDTAHVDADLARLQPFIPDGATINRVTPKNRSLHAQPQQDQPDRQEVSG